MSKILSVTLKLFAVCLMAVTALAAVNLFTTKTIADNLKKDTEAALAKLVPADVYEKQDININEADKDRLSGVYEAYKAKDSSGNLLGGVVLLKTKGFGGDISLTVGLDKNGVITGALVSGHSETPGLGALITTNDFLKQFTGKNSAITLKDIDALTGATVSSRAMVKGTGAAAEYYNKYMKEGK